MKDTTLQITLQLGETEDATQLASNINRLVDLVRLVNEPTGQLDQVSYDLDRLFKSFITGPQWAAMAQPDKDEMFDSYTIIKQILQHAQQCSSACHHREMQPA
jgi:hypothetical protein